MGMKYGKARIAIPLIVLLVFVVAYAVHVPVGNLSSFGWGWISAACPLGALSAILAEKSFVPRAVVAVVLFAVLAIVFGRAFCGWVCPVPLIAKLRPKKKASAGNGAPSRADGRGEGAKMPALACSTCASAGCSSCGGKKRLKLDSRHVVLGGSLLSAVVFGFPVFCLVCPIGLSFSFAVLMVNLFAEGDLTWGLVIVPAILLLELVVCRTWCSKICPLSALMSLGARAGGLLRPSVEEPACIESSGRACGVCAKVCPQGIDPHHPSLGTEVCECTKCMACVEHCPSGAISLPLVAKSSSLDEGRIGESKER
jgi:ferredoxin-type protein NapH